MPMMICFVCNGSPRTHCANTNYQLGKTVTVPSLYLTFRLYTKTKQSMLRLPSGIFSLEKLLKRGDTTDCQKTKAVLVDEKAFSKLFITDIYANK